MFGWYLRLTVKFVICLLINAHVFAAEILNFTPTNAIKNVRTVTARFSSDMIALGDPRTNEEPFLMKCNVPTQNSSQHQEAPPAGTLSYVTRWADTKNWVLEFDADLPSGIHCEFTTNQKLRDLAGNKIVGADEYHFSTSGPRVTAIAPESYVGIEPDQFFVLLLDGSVDTKSVEANAYFEVSGIPEQIQVKLVDSQLRDATIRSAVKSNWRLRDFRKTVEKFPGKPLSEFKEFERFLVISAKRRFPENAEVKLHWTASILSKTGLATGTSEEFKFKVIQPFRAEFSCERKNADRPCNPLMQMNLHFTKSLFLKSLKSAKLVARNGKTWIPTELSQDKSKKGSLGPSDEDLVASLTFKGPFPESSQLKLILPPNLKDDAGRSLENQNKFPLEIATDLFSPIVKFPDTFGILELNAEPVLPVSVRNIEKQMSIQQVTIQGKSLNFSDTKNAAAIIELYHKVKQKEYSYETRHIPVLEEKQGDQFQIPKPLSERELELVGIPLKNPGFYVVELASPKLGDALLDGKPMYVATSALVTDMAVHFKQGRESSLVWVTQLSDARPVSGAKISVVNARGRELASGKTNSDGLLRLDELEETCDSNSDEYEGSEFPINKCEIFVFAQKGEDFSFVSNTWSKGIETYRFNVHSEYLNKQWGPYVMHSILDRMLAQPGEAIQMKHILRNYQSNGFSMMREERLPKRVLIVHEASQKTYTLPFVFDKATGSAINQFVIPKDAVMGRYTIYLSNKDAMPKKESTESEDGDPFDWTAKETGHFIVSEYRIPLMKASVKVQGLPLVRPSEVIADLSAAYLSGGPARGLKVKLRASIQPGEFEPEVPERKEFNFFAEPVKVGLVDSDVYRAPEETFLKVQNLTLNKDGGALAKITDLPAVTSIQKLLVEMEYSDPNGEIKTATKQVPLYPAENIIGIRSYDWYVESSKAKVSGIITNNLGKPKSGVNYSVEAFRRVYYTHRKRLVGGFYSYDSKVEVSAIGKVCEGASDEFGRFTCAPDKLPAGTLILQAKTTDEKGHSTYSAVQLNTYEAGTDNWWTPSDSDRIDLIPEKTRYEPGETARFVLRAPFPTSRVLVTVEREGILDSFVTELSRDNPRIEVPLKGHYAPNIFVSALAIRGRVGEPKPTALLDLGRPAMKMGMAEIKVGWKAHELQVNVSTNKKQYKVREKVQMTVQIKTATGEKLPPNTEIAIAAIDEGILRLKDNTSWKILDAMMGERGLAVRTSSGQNQVVGRRHFGAKAKPPGGGGGADANNSREHFEPVLYWNPRVKLNSAGEAEVSIPLNDSITSFRLVAVASGGTGYFGEGQTNIETNRDLIIYSGFAPLVREGDLIQNAITVRNTTTATMKINMEFKASNVSALSAIAPFELKASEAKTFNLALAIPQGIKEISYVINANDSIGGSIDSMSGKVKVEPAVIDRVMQATLFQLNKTNQVPVKQPADALPGRGGIKIHARSSLVSGLAGVKSYMEDYPYSCMEQQISKAIVLEDKNLVGKAIEALPTYLDQDGLVKFFPGMRCGDPQLTRYILNILKENGYDIPESTRVKMLDGLVSYIHGRYVCRNWWDLFVSKDYNSEGKLLLMESLSKYKAFQANMLGIIREDPEIWTTGVVAAYIRLLEKQPEIPNQKEKREKAKNILRARLSFQGTLMNLQESADWESRWRLFTSGDQEAIDVFGLFINDSTYTLDRNWKDDVKQAAKDLLSKIKGSDSSPQPTVQEASGWADDVGRLARGITARLKKGHWDTTMANAWGLTYLRQFSAKFEKEKVTGDTKITANEVNGVVRWAASPAGEKQTLSWPKDSEKKEVAVQFNHSGAGKPWIHLETLSAIPLKAPLDMGYKLVRKITPVVQASPDRWSVGDVANVEITISAKTDQSWVVVRDPIPAGASHLGTDLAGSSELLDRAPKKDPGASVVQDWPMAYSEKSNASFTSYAAYLPRGTYRLNYRIRLNSAGEFKLPVTRAEAMYSPEYFGEAPSANWQVAQ